MVSPAQNYEVLHFLISFFLLDLSNKCAFLIVLCLAMDHWKLITVL